MDNHLKRKREEAVMPIPKTIANIFLKLSIQIKEIDEIYRQSNSEIRRSLVKKYVEGVALYKLLPESDLEDSKIDELTANLTDQIIKGIDKNQLANLRESLDLSFWRRLAKRGEQLRSVIESEVTKYIANNRGFSISDAIIYEIPFQLIKEEIEDILSSPEVLKFTGGEPLVFWQSEVRYRYTKTLRDKERIEFKQVEILENQIEQAISYLEFREILTFFDVPRENQEKLLELITRLTPPFFPHAKRQFLLTHGYEKLDRGSLPKRNHRDTDINEDLYQLNKRFLKSISSGPDIDFVELNHISNFLQRMVNVFIGRTIDPVEREFILYVEAVSMIRAQLNALYQYVPNGEA